MAVAAAVVIAILMFAGGGGGTTQATTVRRPTPVVFDGPATVDIDNIAYSPSEIRIGVGATVTWNFKDSVPHDVAEDSGVFKSDVVSDGVFSYTFDKPGTYSYHCSLHHKMTGTVRVGDAVTPTRVPAAATQTPVAAAGR